MLDPLRGILFHIMNNRGRTPPHSTDILKLFFFDERFRTFYGFIII